MRLWSDVERAKNAGASKPAPAAATIVDRVMRAPGTISLVAIGPLTNVAIALSLEPRLAGALKSLIVMGGAVHLPGSANELNFGYDPEAAHIVLTSGAPVIVVPMDLTRQTLLRPEDNERFIKSEEKSHRGGGPRSAPWIAWVMAERKQRGCFLHDPLALAVALDPTLVGCEEFDAAVELAGAHTRGRLITWRPSASSLKQEAPRRVGRVAIAREVDNPRFMALLMGRLAGKAHV